MARHFTFEERQFLYRLKRKGKSNPEIAELMGRHRSTVNREMARNSGQRGYRPKQAQRLADERRLALGAALRADHDVCLTIAVEVRRGEEAETFDHGVDFTHRELVEGLLAVEVQLLEQGPEVAGPGVQ